MTELRFSEEYHRCVSDGLKSVLGENGMDAVLFDIESRRCVEDARTLHEKLYGVFGDGAFHIERVIIRKLCQRLNVPYEDPEDFDFAEIVRRVGNFSKGSGTSGQ